MLASLRVDKLIEIDSIEQLATYFKKVHYMVQSFSQKKEFPLEEPSTSTKKKLDSSPYEIETSPILVLYLGTHLVDDVHLKSVCMESTLVTIFEEGLWKI